MTLQRIELGAIVVRDGSILLLRARPDSAWTLPGGPLPLGEDDADEAMESYLMTLGIHAPAVGESFLETVLIPDGESRVVFNLYSPLTDWSGEPTVAPGVGMGWFAPGDLESISFDPNLREAILAAFGLVTRTDQAEAIVRAMNGGSSGAAGFDSRRAAGLDVLRTLSGGDPNAEAELRKGCPELADAIIDFSMGDVWQGAALDRRTRSLLVVAMLAAAGQHGSLRSHIGGALNHGATPEAVIETLKMVAVYAGFPAAVAGWPVMEEVFAERGIPRPKGPGERA